VALKESAEYDPLKFKTVSGLRVYFLQLTFKKPLGGQGSFLMSLVQLIIYEEGNELGAMKLTKRKLQIV